jgi:hypothetical protein
MIFSENQWLTTSAKGRMFQPINGKMVVLGKLPGSAIRRFSGKATMTMGAPF